MKKRNRIKKSIGIFSMACCMTIATALAFMAQGSIVEAKEDFNKIVQGVAYSESDFSVIQDYTVYSDAWRYTPYADDSPTAILKSQDITLYDPGRQEMKIELDEGKSGLLLKSVKSGNDVVGSKFALAEKQLGNFSMTFRGFSEENYRGMNMISSRSGSEYQEGDGMLLQNNGSIYDSRFNPYLDMRGVGVKFTSVSDSEKSFTVHLYGTEMYDLTTVTARVEISGEDVNPDGRKGYGLRLGEKISQPDFAYGYGTKLHHVSFCNSTNGLASFPVSLRFDKDKMCVYGTSYEEHLWSKGDDGVSFRKGERLIRNIGNNTMSDKEDGDPVPVAGLKKLSSDDFEAGYTVEVIVEDMTADETPLTWTLYDESMTEDGVVYGQKIREKDYERSSDKDEGKHPFRAPYERHANIVIYDVNGCDMRVYDGFDVEERQFTCPASAKVPTGGKVLNGLRFTAKAKNEQAEGEHFSLDPTQFTDENGILNVKLGPTSTQYAPKTTTDDTKELWPTQNGLSGLANKNMALDPFSDVKQISITIKSKTDSNKGFKIYFTSRTFKRSAVSAHIEILGEDIMTQSGLRGIGSNKIGNGCLRYDNQTGSMGTFGMKANTVDGPYSWNSTKDVYPIFKFNPKTMEVSTYDYSWHTARKLDEQYKTTNGLTEPFKTLSSADFAGGYDMEVTVEQMNTKWNRGLKTWKQWNKGTPSDFTYAYDPASDGVHILKNEYDRPCVIDVFTFTDGKNVIDNKINDSVNTGKEELDLGNQYSVPLSGEEIEISPVITNGMGKKTAVSQVDYVKQNSGETGSIEIKDGKGIFKCKSPGIYLFSVGSLNRKIRINTDADPVLSLVNDEELIVQNSDFSVSMDDIKIETKWKIVDEKIEVYYNDKKVSPEEVSAKEKGMYKIIYTVVDEGGRTVKLERMVYIVAKDNDIPQIMWNSPVALKVNDIINIEDIKAYDASEGEIKVIVDKVVIKHNDSETELAAEDNKITLSEEGDLFITVSAVDSAGNKSSKEFRIAVTGEEPDIITQDNNICEQSGNKVPENNNTMWIIIGSVIGGVVVIAGVTIAGILVMKRKKK